MSTRTEELYDELDRARRMYRAGKKSYGALKVVSERFGGHGLRMMKKLAERGIETRVDHAYTPRETGSYGGSEHIVVVDDLHEGRLHREAHDALCKPAEKFWGLTHTHGGAPSCKTCIERAERLVEKLEPSTRRPLDDAL